MGTQKKYNQYNKFTINYILILQIYDVILFS